MIFQYLVKTSEHEEVEGVLYSVYKEESESLTICSLFTASALETRFFIVRVGNIFTRTKDSVYPNNPWTLLWRRLFSRNIEMITWISFNIRTFTLKSCNISEIYSRLRQTQTWICASWLRFPLTCLKLFFTFKSSFKLFSSIKIVRLFFICSFSILRNSQPESAFCRLP